jgi:transcriptional regulator with XRE-family HTH domain
VGDHIRKKRLNLKLHQYEIAPIIGVDKTTIFNWERGYSSPKLRQIPKIIEFLGYMPFEEPRTLGERIVYYRRLTGMTQKELAKKLNVDPTTLARWERGERKPDCNSLKLQDYELNKLLCK